MPNKNNKKTSSYVPINTKLKKKYKDWHTAFSAASQLELREIKDWLTIDMETKLPVGHLKCDIVITNKFPERELPPSLANNGVAKCLRGVNYFEYKSPHESLTIGSYIKFTSYCYLKVALNKIPLKQASIIMATSKHPEKLLNKLKKRCGVEELDKGLYRVKRCLVRTYILSLKELPPQYNKWITSLKFNLSTEEIENIFSEYAKNQNDNNFLIFFDFFCTANKDKIKIGENEMNQSMIDILKKHDLLTPIIRQIPESLFKEIAEPRIQEYEQRA
ncbi:MAG: hypothetical protein LBB88_01960, partial [Planctomycetaceae bacterium]|nr:hypothetical protein [Planctomycetaceae bacterium]